MKSGFRLKWKLFWHKVSNWEYWPFSVLYFPVNFYFIWLAIRNRSFFFFTASNPTIDFGGMLGEKKSRIYELIPPEYLPKYSLISTGDIKTALDFAQTIGYPLICKPDIGERGKLVEKINNETALIKYVEKCPVNFLIQELIDYPIELGVFFIRHPNESKGKVTSIVMKDFLHVIGDGKSTVKQLLDTSNRASLVLNFEHERFQTLLQQIPEEGEKIIVENVGNHCRGTTFLNANDQIDGTMNHAFNELADQIEGFHFGRFDLRCQSFEDLRELKNFKVLELNGAGAEPAHIYHPGASLWKGYKDIFWHLDQLAQISRKNKALGIPYWSTKTGLLKMKKIKRYNKAIQDFL